MNDNDRCKACGEEFDNGKRQTCFACSHQFHSICLKRHQLLDRRCWPTPSGKEAEKLSKWNTAGRAW